MSQKHRESIFSQLQRESDKPMDEEARQRLTELRSSGGDDLFKARVQASTRTNVRPGTIGSSLYGCAYPQPAGVDVNCVPECLEGIPIDPKLCRSPVYAKTDTGGFRKVNSVDGDRAHVYLGGNTKLSETEITRMRDDGVSSLDMYRRSKNSISYRADGSLDITEKSKSSKSLSFESTEETTEAVHVPSKEEAGDEFSSIWILVILVILVIIGIAMYCCYRYFYSGQNALGTTPTREILH